MQDMHQAHGVRSSGYGSDPPASLRNHILFLYEAEYLLYHASSVLYKKGSAISGTAQ